MKIVELLTESRLSLYEATVGRDLQHLEDYLIVDGSSGGISSLVTLNNLIQKPDESSVKWDGKSAIYWGNDSNGNFYLVPKAQWQKGQILNKQDLYKEILNTGRKKANQSDIEFRQSRKNLAGEYIRLWDVFEKASEGTQGFFTGDLMFSQPQKPDNNGNYSFTPNKVTYVVEPNGLYGKMPTAQAFVTVHGKSKMPGDKVLLPYSKNDLAQLNKTPELIAIGKQQPKSIKHDNTQITKLNQVIKNKASDIDSIVNYKAPGFTTIKKVLYDYAVKFAKSGDKLKFSDWLQSSNLSANHTKILQNLMKTKEWKTFWDVFMDLKKVKHDVLNSLHTEHSKQLQQNLGLSSFIDGRPSGEGYVTKKGKITSPEFRSAPDNPRFTGEI